VTIGRAAILGLGAAVVFAAGVGLGQAFEDNAHDGSTQTRIRTLVPQPLAPAAQTTVTVTTPASP
jgi:hypothetical protein